jgi:hypothetical protein
MVLSVPISILMILAAVRMLKLRSYRLAIAAAILALLPVGLTIVLGLPIGIWSLIALSGSNVKNAFADSARLGTRSEKQTFPWSAFWVGLAATASFLGLIAFAMYWTDSAWPLLGLVLPCLILGFMAGAEDFDESLKRMQPAMIANMVVTFVGGAALIVYGIVLANSGTPLWIIAACLVATIAGTAAGAEMVEDEKKNQDASANGDREGEQEAPPTGEQLVKTPALLMTISGGALTFFLLVVLSEATAYDLWTYAPGVVGPVILFAGLFMGQLRFYWLAVVGSLLCLPAAMFPFWGWFALPIGVFSLWRLMQPEVRAAFQAKATR